ncbi:membrane protein [Vibrio inusitatus NBRC 102082]|uniref:Membrane protein n=1 Tax=Vibrio inusitatus NBRC 102082 TaxID=1219070 RepID=A0A4Y3HZJ5_9VIBR|nr:TolC family protein [Vibrio inusitatus]GEA52140.1 membrane protein [Vibrio inusitatus NBRC 102082]
MKLKYKRIIIALACGLTFPASAQEVSFSQAWDLVQQQNNSLAAGQANVDRYQNLQSSKKSLNLPSVTLNANYTRLDDDVTLSGEQLADSITTPTALPPISIPFLANSYSTIAEKDVFTSSIRAVWPIFTGGKIISAQSIAAAQTDEARAQLEMDRQARFEDLAKYYFGVVLSKRVVQTYQSVEEGLEQHANFASKLEQQGQIARVEKLQADASLAKARVDRKKSERDLEIAVSALTQILNQSQTVTPKSALFINENLPPLSAYTNETLATYPGLSILDAKEKQAKGLTDVQKGKYYPDVYLYGDYSLYEDDSLAAQLTPDWFVGVGVSIPLIETSGRSGQLEAAHSAVLQITHLRAQAKQDLSVLVQKTYLEAEQSMEEVKGLETSIELAEENLRLRKKMFSQGLSNSLDVVDAELYLASIQTQQHVARFNYLISLNKLLALSGKMNTFSQYESRPNKSVTSTTLGAQGEVNVN